MANAPKMKLEEDVILIGGKYVKSDKFSKEVAQIFLDKNKKDFKNDLSWWKRRYDQYASQTIDKKYKTKSKILYEKWEEMNQKYLGNIPIELLVTLEGDGKSEAKGLRYRFESDAFAATTKSSQIGINASIVKKSLDRQNKYKQGNQSLKYGNHYDNFAKTILTEKPEKPEIWAAYSYFKDSNKKKEEQLRSAYWDVDKRYTFAQQVYGVYSNYDTRVGRIVEVFFNHLAQIHAGNIHIKNNNGIRELDINNTSSVQQEEWPNLLKNMYLWQDNDKYIAGGDINISDANGKILMRIQLKSTSRGKSLQKLSDTIGNEVDLGIIYNHWVIPFLDWCQTDDPVIANDALKNIAEALKTSVWIPLEEEVKTGIENHIDSFVHYVDTKFTLNNNKNQPKKKKSVIKN